MLSRRASSPLCSASSYVCNTSTSPCTVSAKSSALELRVRITTLRAAQGPGVELLGHLLRARPDVVLVASTTAPAGPEDVIGRAMARVGCHLERFLAPVEPGKIHWRAHQKPPEQIAPVELWSGEGLKGSGQTGRQSSNARRLNQQCSLL